MWSLAFDKRRPITSYIALSRCLELLAANPEMGGAAQDIRPGYRCLPHERHVIFYTADPDGPLVVRTLHQRMDITKGFRTANSSLRTKLVETAFAWQQP